jgi:hypothetical protein
MLGCEYYYKEGCVAQTWNAMVGLLAFCLRLKYRDLVVSFAVALVGALLFSNVK